MRIVKVSDTLSQASLKINNEIESIIAPHDEVISVALQLLSDSKS